MYTVDRARPALAQNFVTQMLTRDHLFAVADIPHHFYVETEFIFGVFIAFERSRSLAVILV